MQLGEMRSSITAGSIRQQFDTVQTRLNASINALQSISDTARPSHDDMCIAVQIDALPNLSIPAVVGEQIASAQQHVADAMGVAELGHFEAALASARRARTAIEVAASHPAIVSQHNYPQQHLLAVYLPLFAPLSLPVLATVAFEAKRAIGKLRSPH